MRKLTPLLVVLAGTVPFLACGGGGGSSGSGGASTSSAGSGGFTCAPPTTNPTAACTMCVETHCAAEYQDICDNHCSAPGPTTPLSPQCQEAEDALGPCIDDQCPGCDPDDEDEDGGGGRGGTGGSGGSGGRGGSGAGGSGGAPGPGEGCVEASVFCNWYPSSALPASAVAAECMTAGGTVVDHCPSAGLLGCCMQPTGTLCSYGADNPEVHVAADCGTAGGLWTTTPP